MSQRRDKRTSVSLDPVVWGWAVERMTAGGFNGNFSAYVASLIRADQERRAGKSDAPFIASTAAPLRIELNETPTGYHATKKKGKP